MKNNAIKLGPKTKDLVHIGTVLYNKNYMYIVRNITEKLNRGKIAKTITLEVRYDPDVSNFGKFLYVSLSDVYGMYID